MHPNSFRARSEHNLDAKGRLNIPARFVSVLNDRESNVLIVAPWFDHLRAYPIDEWSDVEAKLLSSGNAGNKKFVNWVRMTMGALAEVSPDKQGRILLTQLLRDKANLDKEVVLTGMGAWFEIWDKPSILAKDAGTMEDSEAHQETLAEMGFFIMAGEIAPDTIHVSVLLAECVRFLNLHPGGLYVDGTLGLGGHTEAILSATSPEGKVVAFEWDERARNLARERLQPYGDRLTVIPRNFAEIKEGLRDAEIESIDGLLIDIGLSSLQLDMGKRGFSFQVDEPLDMRMDLTRDVTAESLVNTCSFEELADIFYYYGDERQARPVAAAIVEARQKKEIATTAELVAVVSGAIPKKYHPKKIHVATRVFQALRIAVNSELENLARIIDDGVEFLKPGARFCVISFHSLEDRIVKRKFAANSSLEVITRKPVVPTPEEAARNPRARSARLRVAEKKIL